METQRIEISPSRISGRPILVSLSKPGGPRTDVEEFLLIGRDAGCQLRIDDPYVSSRHARIERKTGGFVLRDLQSRNGTFLNGARITEAVLAANDRLRIGEHVFLFTDSLMGSAKPLTSKNTAWAADLARVPGFAASGLPVLITGPSGTGKELLARELHDRSNRATGPFVGLNCGALNESLIESELFGHIKGSFTGANNDRKGAFEAARGGSLFLDEIGDLPLALQPKLLRALESGEIRPVGSDRLIETDVRIIAATHKNLGEEIKAGRFREDLYYRLNVCRLTPPSLSERTEDFTDIVYAFAKVFRVRFSLKAIEKLQQQPWPGNIRELKNVIARASAYFPGKHIQPEDLDAVLDRHEVKPPAPRPQAPAEAPVPPNEPSVGAGPIIKEIEREIILRRLSANGGNQRRTALDLGMPKSTLHDRLKNYAIDPRKFEKEVSS